MFQSFIASLILLQFSVVHGQPSPSGDRPLSRLEKIEAVFAKLSLDQKLIQETQAFGKTDACKSGESPSPFVVAMASALRRGGSFPFQSGDVTIKGEDAWGLAKLAPPGLKNAKYKSDWIVYRDAKRNGQLTPYDLVSDLCSGRDALFPPTKELFTASPQQILIWDATLLDKN